MNQEILKAEKTITTVRKLFQLVCPWRCGFAENVLQVILFTVLWFKWSVKKNCVAILLAIWERFLHENNRNYISYRFSYKFTFILFKSFLTSQKQESGFQQVGGLTTRNICFFYGESRYLKAMPNSTNFYKGIFLRVIPVCIIVPWL